MFLSEALNTLKNLKSKLTRTEKYIEQSAHYFEGETPSMEYAELSKERDNLLKDILSLKTKIQITNVLTTSDVVENEKPITLAELILRNAAVRSELAYLNKQLAKIEELSSVSRYSRRTKDDLKVTFAESFDIKSISKTIDEQQSLKEFWDTAIVRNNSITKLIEE